MSDKNPNGWSENKYLVLESLEQLREEVKQIKTDTVKIREDLAGFKGRIIGAAAAVSAVIALLADILF